MDSVTLGSAPAAHRAPARQGPRPGTRGGGRIGLALGLLLLLALLAAASLGAVRVSWVDWGQAFAAERSGSAQVLWQLRVPRALLAAAVGAALGLSGALSQGLFRNPLADPGLLGVTSGAVCAVALVLTVFAAAASGLPPPWRPWVLPLAAFGGALGVVVLLHLVARWLTPGSVAGLLLTGLALNALAMAVVGLCTFIASDEQLRSLSFWTLGSLAGATWTVAGVLLAAVGLALWHGRRLAAALNALALGEASAAHVGVDVPRLRRGLVFAVALLSALAVAWCGLIGFIGLMAPHLVRAAAGADQRRVLPLAALAGALLLVVADTLARLVALPAEVPVGILTALIGAPAFLLLLRGVARRQGGQP
ncbi:FecCD family ABC transporter permease [Piscinibacter sakaiensis]|uniref:Hemin ABC transporter, permease protein n=1 Tax=Piscinibacter sakaiensis TaxID=1547922 RepID=A0A0K8P768_PISS1|nr:iron ABC transporter permease [Piscinibacter sakaiensis]GAP38055.1 hemin ABC transporter, permease protein [Piscinibacter sakaiensis]